ncbi:MAG: hypothetical protein AMXMBFR77_27830 [Phycisphaerales bacterium]
MIVDCECGCGTPIETPDPHGRPRSCGQGHNSRLRPSPLRDAVVRALGRGPAETGQIWRRLGGFRCKTTYGAVRVATQAARRKGLVQRTADGLWALADCDDGDACAGGGR